MTENKDDLISREALKKKLTPIKLYGGVYCKVITEKDIDDAPTVELLMGRMTNGVIIPIESPQGEWIPIKSLMEDNHHSRISFRCNQCRYVEGYRAKYCAGCGTFMQAKVYPPSDPEDIVKAIKNMEEQKHEV